ncbi:hypothetical protein I4U23_023703 [Adineta vaga]|nr:hypothetical protein I4U23_023703 [Adineta vaga]
MLKVVSSLLEQRRENQFIPLKNVAVEVNIHSFAAEVFIKQVFINSEETNVPIEAVYCFPVEEAAAIYSFEATIDDDRKIQGEIKEKKTAQRDYCDALKKGHGAFLLEQDEKSNDIFTISVGSLKPQSKCEIEIRYVQELELIDDGQRIQFVLPTVIAPRYSSISAGHGHIKSPGTTTANYVQSAPYSISFSCTISSLPIASVGSPSHPIEVTSQLCNTSHSIVKARLSQENTHLDRDIILNVNLQQQQILTYTFVEKQAVMVSLVPTLELCDKNNQTGQANCEYIFVVDCSGSMNDENKIDYARQAMSVFIKSLPIDSHFNIIQFGSAYQIFKSNAITIEYNEQTANEAANYIKKMKADLGGTELYSVLSHLQQNPPQGNYSRQIFLLTDGEIEDVDRVIRLCHSMSNTTRIFSFGLGSSPSRALVKGLARMTNGAYLFIPPKTHIDVAVARQLDKALAPCLVNVKVRCRFKNNELENYRISPKILPPIHAKQRLNIYIMMPKNIEDKLHGSLEFLTQNNDLLERVTFTDVQPSSTLLATRLAAKSIIKDLQTDDYKSNSSRQARFSGQEKNNIKQELIDISIQHQILSPFTAFIGIETRTEQERAAIASSGEMILREIPIEINNENDLLPDDESASYHAMPVDCDQVKCGYTVDDEEEAVCDDDDEEDDYEENGVCHYVDEEEEAVCDDDDNDDEEEALLDDESFYMLRSPKNDRGIERISRNFRSRSRSRSPRQQSSSKSFDSSCDDDNLSAHEDMPNDNSCDIIRQIIALQNFNGLWSIKNLKQMITLSQSNTIKTDVDFEKIIDDFKDKDNDAILSVIIMCILAKYFPDDEPLWKPLIKKCKKALENRLGNNEANHISNTIKQLV